MNPNAAPFRPSGDLSLHPGHGPEFEGGWEDEEWNKEAEVCVLHCCDVNLVLLVSIRALPLPLAFLPTPSILKANKGSQL